jgi:hypothetical protein
LPNYPNSKQVVRSAEFKYNAVSADPSIPGASILKKRDVVSVPFNPLFNPMIIDDGDIKVSLGKTDTSITASQEKVRTASKIDGTKTRPPPSPQRANKKKEKAVKVNKENTEVRNKKPLEVNGLQDMKRRDISELKAFKAPPVDVEDVTKAIVKFIIPNATTKTWEDTRSYLDATFLKSIKSIFIDDIPNKRAKELRKICTKSNITIESLKKKTLIGSVLFDVLRKVYEEKTGEKILVKSEEGTEGISEVKGGEEEGGEGGEGGRGGEIKEVEDPLVREVITVYRCNPRLMKTRPPKYFLSIPSAGVTVERGLSAQDLVK